MSDLSGVHKLIQGMAAQARPADEPRRAGDLGTGGGLRVDDSSADSSGVSFGDMLTEGLQEVSQRQQDVRSEMEKFATGKSEGIHDVMLAMGKSEVSFSLMLEVRNRLVDAWREITRIQV